MYILMAWVVTVTLEMEADGLAVYWEIRVKKTQNLVWFGVGEGSKRKKNCPELEDLNSWAGGKIAGMGKLKVDQVWVSQLVLVVKNSPANQEM